MQAQPLFQLSRPSPHSYVVLLSHASYALTLRTAVRHRQYLELCSLALSLAISVGYHICDENVHCGLGLDVVRWHALDVWSTFFLICFVIGVRAMNFATKGARVVVRCVYLFLITLFVFLDRGSAVLFGALLASVAIGLVCRHLIAGAVGGDATYLALGLGVFACSLGCFVIANTPIIGPVTWDGLPGTLKPMDVPDTAVYWAFHSVWHFASALSAHFLLVFNAPKHRQRRRHME
jgi:hypothetical protein